MSLIKWLLGNNTESEHNPPKYDSDVFKLQREMEQMSLKSKKENEQKIKDLASNLYRFGAVSQLDWMEAKDLFTLVSRNPHMNGEQLFEVVDKDTGDRFLAHYYSTENSFVNPLDHDDWIYDKDSDWENQLNNYKAIPVFINYKTKIK